MTNQPAPPDLTEADLARRVAELRNWNRWGADDQLGTMNLVTPEIIVAATRLVRHGECYSLARPIPTAAAGNNPRPAEHFMGTVSLGVQSKGATDYVAMSCHGVAMTHLDALCHLWNGDGMWNGRDPQVEIDYSGARWGGVEQYVRGIVGRGVLLDVAALRDRGFVDVADPATGDDLAAAAAAAGVTVSPGDIVVVNCGRDRWEAEHGEVWGAPGPGPEEARPGLDPSCLEYLRAVDAGALVWDMMDARPNIYRARQTVHAAVFALGIALIDNATTDQLAAACRAHDQYEFLIVTAPLRLIGGTGSPVNPLAIL